MGREAERVTPDGADRGTAREVFGAFLRLGLTSFGGPVAHLGYFRADLVARRGWVDEAAYAEVVGLCQLLPGPTSSQVGFVLGLLRGGWRGALAAWAGFTLPSATLMLLFAAGAPGLSASHVGAGLLQGLKLAAVAVVAQAVWSMARSLCPDLVRAGIALAAAGIALSAPAAVTQLAAILGGGLLGVALVPIGAVSPPPPSSSKRPSDAPLTRRTGALLSIAFAVLLALATLGRGALDPWAAFVRSGALVFGGGHVVLPLLADSLVAPGWVPDASFLAGYGAVQAMPGPLFSVAAYLGAAGRSPLGGGFAGSAALVAIFLPGLLLAAGMLPFWRTLTRAPRARAAVAGINAAVVGLLAAALYDPVWTGSVHEPTDIALAVAAVVLLVAVRAPAILVVALAGAAGALLR